MSDGVVVWITGLPSSGKSTLAGRALERLREAGRTACLLDGDAVRGCLVPNPGYAPAARADFYATLANLAVLLAGQGLAVLVAATAHKREFREQARRSAPHFLELWVDTPPEECARRDTKGLYAAARAGQNADVPGAGAGYERPEAPDVIAHGGLDDDAVAALVTHVLRTAPPPTQNPR